MKKGVMLIMSVIGGVALGAVGANKTAGKKIRDKQKMSDKHLALFKMMDQWVRVKQEGKDLSSYFESKGYKNIAVYGMSFAGKTFIEELRGTDIKVAYGIDKNADSIYTDEYVFSIDDDLESVDAVVVTAITFFDEIEEHLSKKMDCPIISLEDILYDV